MQLTATPPPTPDIARVERFSVHFPDRLTTYEAPASAAGVRDELASIASRHKVAMSPIEEGFLETFPMQFQLSGTFTGETSAVEQAVAAAKAIQPNATTGPGLPTAAPTAPAADAVSSAFNLLYSEFGPSSAANAGERVEFAARQHGVQLTDLDVGPAVLESLPPQGSVSGTVTGSADAVKQALAAFELLDQEL